ncbi:MULTISPECIES: hypothetical protein [unclassified Sphingomonas]|uniref:hypothetical protein n=1 Tax=unclassified Sphingomonas TaxID=196159 RepID=UPI001F5864FA|nr:MULTISPECIES: hypothetical protein [unclassified Sphingomonas]
MTISGLFALAVQPAPDAALLAVPLSDAAADGIVRIATHHGAQLIGTGPLAGWIVLRGGDDGLRGALRRIGVLLVAAPPAGCGTGTPA